MLRTEAILRTFNQLQAHDEPLPQSRHVSTPVRQVPIPVRQVPTPVRQVSTPVRQVSAPIRRAAIYNSEDLEKATEIFQQMLLKDNLPWIPDQVKPQAAEPRDHMPRRAHGLNPEAAEFHITQNNKKLSNNATSTAFESDCSGRNSTMSAAFEQIKMLENEVAALKLALNKQSEECTCKAEESKWEEELQNPKQFSDYASLDDSRQLEVDNDGASSDLLEL